jgi:hypothetical protein
MVQANIYTLNTQKNLSNLIYQEETDYVVLIRF